MTPINKIVQTLWTKPIYEDNRDKTQNRFQGGWLSRKYYYMAWTLSCMQFRRYYPNVELVTDSRGQQLLIDKLNLPYTRIRNELDCLNHYPSSLWTLPKIYTYKIQEEPFIHADGDVFIWEKFGNTIECARLCSQQIVVDHKPQYIVMEEIEKNFNYIPECIRNDRKQNVKLKISNAGLIGGTDLDFFREYANLANDFVERNIDKLKYIKSGVFGMIFEEYLFYCFAKEKGIEITYLLEPLTDDFTGTKLVDFETVPSITKFIHPVGTYKKYQQICDLLEITLQLNYPYYYYKILKLLNDFEI
jgi:hypothetical protein